MPKQSFTATLWTQLPAMSIAIAIAFVANGFTMWRAIPTLEASNTHIAARVDEVEKRVAKQDEELKIMYEMKGTLDALLKTTLALHEDIREVAKALQRHMQREPPPPQR